jgi:V8-like Glu-specific endopeptidase
VFRYQHGTKKHRGGKTVLKLQATLLLGAIAIGLSAPAQAQDIQSVPKKYSWSTGSVANTSVSDKMVARHTVSVPRNSAGLRIHFAKAHFGKDALIRIRTEVDHQTIVLNEEKLAAFNFATPYLNGSSAVVELWVRGGAKTAGIAIVGIEAILPKPRTESICGSSDDRVDSNITAIGRMLSTGTDEGGCTGTLISENCMVSAGHCAADGYTNLAEFNVPRSNADGSPNHPSAENQYPMEKLYDFQNDGAGQDWSVYRIKANPMTSKTAGSLQGIFKIRTEMTKPGDKIRITGYGTDDGEDNVAQQTNAATVVQVNGSEIVHDVDTMPGNSGSTIINEDTKEIIGIHTHGGCSGGGNHGTLLIAHERFKKAVAACLADDKKEGFSVGRNRR